MTTKTDLTALLAGVDIGELLGLTLRGPMGGERHGPCPKCGGTKHFWTNWRDGRNYFSCRECNPKGGDLIDLLKWRDGLTTGEAIREAERLIGRAPARVASPAIYQATGQEYEDPPPDEWQASIGMVIEACAAELWANSPHGEAARAWLHGRGLTDDTLRAFRVGYQGRAPGTEIAGHYVAQGFTLASIGAGKVWQVRVRRPPKALAANPNLSKYTGIKGNKTGLFNAASLRGTPAAAILCAGEFDAMLVAQELAGIGRADVAAVTFGTEGKSPSVRWLMALARVARVLIAYDTDTAGEAGAAKWATDLGERARRVRVPEGLTAAGKPIKDITDYHLTGAGKLGAWLASILADVPAARPASGPPATAPASMRGPELAGDPDAWAPTDTAAADNPDAWPAILADDPATVGTDRPAIPTPCQARPAWIAPADPVARAIEAEDLRRALADDSAGTLSEAEQMAMIARLAVCEGQPDSLAIELHGAPWHDLAQGAPLAIAGEGGAT